MKRHILFLVNAAILLVLLSGCTGDTSVYDETENSGLGNGWRPISSMDRQYATQFAVDYYPEGYTLITIVDGSRFLVIPEGKTVPKGIDPGVKTLYQPIQNIYLAAPACMALFDAMDGLNAIRFSGTREDGWYLENARQAMHNGDILFAGKYSEPDYEMLLDGHCSLALESTMIGHVSDVKETLDRLGIPVLVDHSSFEQHPLGRTEWIRLYGILLNKQMEADEIFRQQVDLLNEVMNGIDTEKSVAFFSISASGRVVARKSGDYVSQMIELAGGHYVFQNLGDPEKATATQTIEMETFFAAAKDADYLIYNSTMGGDVDSLEKLVSKNKLLSEFKAVQNGNVWCTGQNMYQQTTQAGRMIQSFHAVFSGEANALDELPFMFRLK